MATFNIFRLRIGNVGVGDYTTGRIVYVKWNDSTNDFQVDVHSTADVFIATQTSGPDLTVDDYTETIYNFQFCDSSTLVTFNSNYVTYPYGVRVNTPNASQCVANHVCDILVTEVVTTDASTSTSTDGQAVVTVDGVDTPFVYSLASDFSNPQSTSTFTGLSSGSYRVYVKDSYACVSSKAFTIGYVSSYSERWRLEFDSKVNTFSYKVSIFERDYAGSVSEVKGADTPFILKYEGDNEDKFKQIIASKATINLTVETSGQFEDIFSGDERQFLVKFYIDEGAGYVLEWQGYVLQESYEENWQAEPFYISFYATDGLGDLESEQFNGGDVIKGNKSLISILSTCLVPTDLGINIRSAINRFETNHDQTASDDPLAQTYFDTYFLNGKTCAEVLEELLKTFGARIFQSSAVFWIVSIEDTISSSLPYRVFNSSGTYQSNSTLSPQIDIEYPGITDTLNWTGIPLMRIKNGYKRVSITHNLGLVNNIFYTGRFHEDDYDSNTRLFKDIGIDLLQAYGADYGLKEIRNGQSEHCFYIDFTNADTVSLNFPFIYTLSKTVTQNATIDFYKFSFYYYVNSQSLFTRFDWQIKMGSNYLQPDGNFSSDTDFQYVPIYVDSSEYNRWNKFEFDFSPSTGTDIQAKIRLYSNNSYDYSSLAALAAANTAPSTTGFRIGDRRIALDGSYLRHYTLNYSDAVTASPDIIRAADWATSPRVWFLDATTEFTVQNNLVNYYLLDELKLEFFPDNLEPADTKVYSVTINQNNKVPYEDDCFFGDLPGETNDEHLYKNVFQLEDGSYTELWGRSTTDEAIPILDILALDISGQNSLGTRTMSGSLVGDITLRAENCLVDPNDSNRKYMVLSLEADYANGIYSVELPEIRSGVTGPPSDTSGFTEGFSLGFRS